MEGGADGDKAAQPLGEGTGGWGRFLSEDLEKCNKLCR